MSLISLFEEMFLLKLNYFLLFHSGRLSTISITKITNGFLNGILNQLVYLNSTLGSKPGASFSIGVEPFISSYFNKSSPGAYPHVASPNPLFPLLIQFGWLLPSDDKPFLNKLQPTTDALLQLARNDGQNVGGSNLIAYPNYASEDTPLSRLYGKNLPILQKIRQAWDPKKIMYCAGGYKL